MKVKELKKILQKYDENADVIINYVCGDEWYDYRGSEIEEGQAKDCLVLEISQ